MLSRVLSLVALVFVVTQHAQAQTSPVVEKKVENVTIGPGITHTMSVMCPAGKKATGGGFTIGTPQYGRIEGSLPDATGTAWTIVIRNYSIMAGATEVTAFVVCI
jgi:hypothetical protein